jgi:hypothetical protein
VRCPRRKPDTNRAAPLNTNTIASATARIGPRVFVGDRPRTAVGGTSRAGAGSAEAPGEGVVEGSDGSIADVVFSGSG